jgi:outer membrane protein OmpA-like peptidoglycan-associated protein
MAEPFPLEISRHESPQSAAGEAASLFSAVKASIGYEVPRHAARQFAVDEARARIAFDLLVLAVLRALARRSRSAEGASRIFAELGSPHLDDEVAAALGLLVDDAPFDSRTDGATAAVHRLLGGSARGVVLEVASTTGLRLEAVSALLGVVTLLVIAGLRDYVNVGGLDANALRARLAAEYPSAPRARALRSALSDGRRPAARTRRAFALAALTVALWAMVAIAWRAVLAPDEPLPPPGESAQHPATSPAMRELVEFVSNNGAEREFVLALDAVRFDPKSTTIDSVANAQLRAIATVLAKSPKIRTVVAVHAEGGTEEDHELAKQRAAAVRAALAVFGLPLAQSHHVAAAAEVPGPLVEARVSKP